MEYSSAHGMDDGLMNTAVVATCPRLGHDHSIVDREGFMRPTPSLKSCRQLTVAGIQSHRLSGGAAGKLPLLKHITVSQCLCKL